MSPFRDVRDELLGFDLGDLSDLGDLKCLEDGGSEPRPLL